MGMGVGRQGFLEWAFWRVAHEHDVRACSFYLILLQLEHLNSEQKQTNFR